MVADEDLRVGAVVPDYRIAVAWFEYVVFIHIGLERWYLWGRISPTPVK
jgi:hypothetical protein